MTFLAQIFTEPHKQPAVIHNCYIELYDKPRQGLFADRAISRKENQKTGMVSTLAVLLLLPTGCLETQDQSQALLYQLTFMNIIYYRF